VLAPGRDVGRRFAVRAEVIVLGRDPKCDIVPQGAEAAFVSTRHAEIRHTGAGYRIRDLGSTNGTFINGVRIKDTAIEPGSSIQLGTSGPIYRFEPMAEESIDLGATLTSPAPKQSSAQLADPDHDALVSEAVRDVRNARDLGHSGQTTVIMRRMLDVALAKSGQKHRRTIRLLATALVLVIAGSAWRIWVLHNEKRDIDHEIAAIESEIEQGGLQDKEIEALVETLNGYQADAQRLQQSMFFRLGPEGRQEAFIESEIRALLAEFGAEQYSIPPEFTAQTKQYLERYQTTDRALVERALGSRRQELETMRAIFTGMNLPPDLVYMVVVESAFITQSLSSRGAAGLWQFTPATARAYGLHVDGEADERYDLEKSTRAAGRYVRELILDFGAGSSVMLALAAYNLGPGKVKRAVRKVHDPIKQRNFWYLYRVRALPRETRQYVPKIIAGIIVGRNLDRFGF